MGCGGTLVKVIRAINIILAVCLITACTVMLSFAEDGSELTIYNTRIVTNDTNATYIEGEVPVARGQEIVVSNGFTTIAAKTLPDTNEKAEFRIKIPSKKISKSRVTVVYVKTENDASDSGMILGKRVEINYKERKAQEISTADNKFSMTYPGLDAPLEAKATSGDELLYISSNPDVATVDKNGNIVAKGEGKADISIQQIGTGEYEKAEKSVSVDVKSIDAYSITFHSSDDANEVTKQIIPMDSEQTLQPNTFENGSHQFLGWATEDDGLVKYWDSDQVEDLAEKGKNTDLYAVWSGDGARAAVAWAIMIANDDSFAYGAKPAANNIGCYFCGTNCGPVRYNKPSGYEKTYVCLTFVGAAYAHGAEDPEILYADTHAKMPLYLNDNNFSRFSCWTKLGSCASLSIDDLEPGDVIIQWSSTNDNDGHAWMYAGDDQIVESTGGGWGANSIALKGGASSRLASYSGSSSNFVMRYTGPNAEN
ncbi:MAG: hypothetical protein E7227_07615 [Clostridiales bacterium]|nr:hypothetical protein [Clostridiales bacterium]